MPIELELITQPSPQDHIDLDKIYADRPDWMPLPECAGGPAQAQVKLFAARFNGRLLAAVIAEQTVRGWRLQQLCVRAVTRGRGVASWLLELVAKEAQKENTRCLLETGPLPERARNLLQRLPAELWTSGQIQLEGETPPSN